MKESIVVTSWFVLVSSVVIAALLLFGCPATMPPEPPYVVFPPYDGGDFDAEVQTTADCRAYCESLAKLGCPESAPQGRTCSSTCSAATAAGHDLKPWCVATAATPDQVRACCPFGQPCSPTRCRGR